MIINKNINNVLAKATISFVLILLISTKLYAQQNVIRWEKNKILMWEDFQGAVPNKKNMGVAGGVAGVIAGINTSYNNINDTLIINVVAEFDCLKSWVKKQEPDNYILNHEQKHFDIYEIYARKLRKELLNIIITKRNIYNIHNVISIRDSIQIQVRLEQDKYDKETEHSENKEAQAKWDKYIIMQLKELEAYENREIKVSRPKIGLH